MTPEALLKLAIQAQTEPAAIPVLGDVLIEMDEVERLKPFVMALLIGVPLDDAIPEKHLYRGQTARDNYRRKRQESLAECQEFWPQYFASASSAWARAVLAVLLFRSWRSATTPTQGDYRLRTRSPWALIREPANRSAREIKAALAASRQARGPGAITLTGMSATDSVPGTYIDVRFAEGPMTVQTVAQRYRGDT
jgi:hypothetical protein